MGMTGEEMADWVIAILEKEIGRLEKEIAELKQNNIELHAMLECD